MKALLSSAPGGPETLAFGELPDPQPGEGEVLISVRACGINFLDTLIIQDLYQQKPSRPFAPGSEISGVIEAVGAGVTDWKPGDRVVGMPLVGGLAEKLVMSAKEIFALPDKLDFVAGAGLLLTYGTAIHALKDKARMTPGETLLVLGAAGGAGLAAVGMGKALGLRVIAAVSNEAKAQAARDAGADDVVIYPRAPFEGEQARALSRAFKTACGGEGADIVFDAVGGEYAEPAMRALAWRGRYLVIGFAAGIPTLPLNLALLKEADICGVFYGAFTERDPSHNAELAAELMELAATGRIRSHVSATRPLERGGEAIALLADRQAVGKVVVTIPG
jgi:NADPH:quinone reductase